MAIDNPYHYYFNQKQFKTPNIFHLKNGLVNRLVLYAGVDNTLKLDLAYGDDGAVNKIEYAYNNNKVTLEDNTSLTNISLDVNMINKTDLSPIVLTIKSFENSKCYDTEKTFKVPLEYLTATNKVYFTGFLNSSKIKMFKLGADLVLNQDTAIPSDILIKGENHTLEVGGTLTIKEGVTVKIYDTHFVNGTPLFIQEEGSTLELYNCTFEDCTADDFEGVGSCIHNDIDLEGLEISDDFKTSLYDCSFINCLCPISSGGELIIDNCSFLLNDGFNKEFYNVPSFLYQIDGVASIRNSLFDIDLHTEGFCTNNDNLKLLPCLLVAGENAVINNTTSDKLKKDNGLNFFDNPYFNRSHIFIKYYYPPIEECIYLSPVPSKEDKSVCYAVSGLDWIFKQNVQITRANWGTENEINNIRW